MKFEPVTTEKSTVTKASEVLLAFGWWAFFLLLLVSPPIVIAIWRGLL